MYALTDLKKNTYSWMLCGLKKPCPPICIDMWTNIRILSHVYNLGTGLSYNNVLGFSTHILKGI